MIDIMMIITLVEQDGGRHDDSSMSEWHFPWSFLSPSICALPMARFRWFDFIGTGWMSSSASHRQPLMLELLYRLIYDYHTRCGTIPTEATPLHARVAIIPIWWGPPCARAFQKMYTMWGVPRYSRQPAFSRHCCIIPQSRTGIIYIDFRCLQESISTAQHESTPKWRRRYFSMTWLSSILQREERSCFSTYALLSYPPANLSSRYRRIMHENKWCRRWCERWDGRAWF